MQRLAELGAVIVPVVVGATGTFEVIAPVFTRLALRKVGEAPGYLQSAHGDD